jgi:hypothetical protein
MNLVENCSELMWDTISELLKLLSFQEDAKAGYRLREQKYDELQNEIRNRFKEINSGSEKPSSLQKIRASVQLNDFENRHPVHFEDTINNSVIIYSCSIFDVYLNKTLEHLFEANPRILSTSKKTISYETVFTKSFEIIKADIINREINELSYKRIDERINFMSEKFDLDIEFVEAKTVYFSPRINKDLLIKSFALRNLILHNGGIVNRIFLDLVSDSNYKLGETIEVSNELVKTTLMTVVQASTSIFRQIQIRYW